MAVHYTDTAPYSFPPLYLKEVEHKSSGYIISALNDNEIQG